MFLENCLKILYKTDMNNSGLKNGSGQNCPCILFQINQLCALFFINSVLLNLIDNKQFFLKRAMVEKVLNGILRPQRLILLVC